MVQLLPMRISAVVRYAGQRAILIAAVGRLKPCVARAQVFRDAELQSLPARRLLPGTDDIAFRPHLHSVPSVVF